MIIHGKNEFVYCTILLKYVSDGMVTDHSSDLQAGDCCISAHVSRCVGNGGLLNILKAISSFLCTVSTLHSLRGEPGNEATVSADPTCWRCILYPYMNVHLLYSLLYGAHWLPRLHPSMAWITFVARLCKYSIHCCYTCKLLMKLWVSGVSIIWLMEESSLSAFNAKAVA